MQQPPYPPAGQPPAPAVFGAAPVPYVSQLPVQAAQRDSADLFVETLPSPSLRAATITAIATGAILVLMAFRLVINVEGLVVNVIEGLMALGAFGHFVAAAKMGGGRMWAAILVFVLVPIVLLAAAFTFVTGVTATAMTGQTVSLLSFFPAAIGGVLGVLESVLVGVSIPAIRRIARAKAELARQAAMGV